MDVEIGVRAWLARMEQRRAEAQAVAEAALTAAMDEFVRDFRAHDLHGRTWRLKPYWRALGRRQWVEFQMSKAAMAALMKNRSGR